MNCKRHSIRLNFDSLSFSFNVRKNLICYIYIYIIFIYRSSILSVKTNFPSRKKSKRTYSYFRSLEMTSPLLASQTNLLFQTNEKQKERSCLQSRTTLSKQSRTLNFPSISRQRESLSLSLNFLPRGKTEG